MSCVLGLVWHVQYINTPPTPTYVCPDFYHSDDRVPHLVPSLNVKGEDHANTAQERHSPQLRKRLCLIEHIDVVVDESRHQVSNAQPIEPAAIDFCDIGRNHRGSEKPNVFEAVLLCAFSAQDATLGFAVDALVGLELAGKAARFLDVEFFLCGGFVGP